MVAITVDFHRRDGDHAPSRRAPLGSRRVLRALRSLVTLPMLAGCYEYRPVGGMRPAMAERVRLTLTDSGAVSLASQLGPATEQVSGRVLTDSAGALLVAVTGTRRRGGAESDWKGEQVIVPRTLIARTEERRFSRTRTVLASVAVLTAAIVARQAFWGPGGVFGGAPPGGGPAPR